MFACSESAIDRPAGSSAPLFSREPEDSCTNVFCKDELVWLSWFSASSDVMLFRRLIAITILLFASFRQANFPFGLRASAPRLLPSISDSRNATAECNPLANQVGCHARRRSEGR